MTYVGTQNFFNLKYKVEVYDGTSWVEVRLGTGTLDRDVDYISSTLTLQGIDGAYWYRNSDPILGADDEPLLKAGRRIRVMRIWGKTNPISEQRFVGYIGTPKYDAKTRKVSVEAYCDLYWVLRSEVVFDTINRNNSTKRVVSFNGAYDETKTLLYSETTNWYDFAGPTGGLIRPRIQLTIPSAYSTKPYILGRLSNIKLEIKNPGPFLNDQVNIEMTTFLYVNGDEDARVAEVKTTINKSAKPNDVIEISLGDISFALTSYPSQIHLGADFELLEGCAIFTSLIPGLGNILAGCLYRYSYDLFITGYETTDDIITVDKTVVGDGIVLTIQDSSGSPKTIDESMFVGIKILSPFINPKTKDWFTTEELTDEQPTPTGLISEKEVLPGDQGFVLGALKGQVILPSTTIPNHIRDYVVYQKEWLLSDIIKNAIITAYLIDSNYSLQELLTDLLTRSGASNLNLTSTYPTLVKVGSYSIAKRTKFEDILRELKGGVLPRSYVLYSDTSGQVKDDVYSVSSASLRQFSRAKNRTPAERSPDELVTAYQITVGKVDSLEILKNKSYYVGLDSDNESFLKSVNNYGDSLFEKDLGGETTLYAFLQPDVIPRYIDLQFEYIQNDDPVEVSSQVFVALWEDLMDLSGPLSFSDLPWKNVGGQGSNTYLGSGLSTIDISGMISRPVAAIKIVLDIKGTVAFKRWFLYEDTETKHVELSPYPQNVPVKVAKYVWNGDEEPTGDDVSNIAATGYIDPIPGSTTYKLIATKHFLYSPSLSRFEIDTDRPVVGTSNKNILLPYEGLAVSNEKYMAAPFADNCNRNEAQYGLACGIFKARGEGLPRATISQIDVWRVGHMADQEQYTFPTKGDLSGTPKGVLIFTNESSDDSGIDHDIIYIESANMTYTAKKISFTLPTMVHILLVSSNLPGVLDKKVNAVAAFNYTSSQIPYISRDLGRNDAFLVDDGIMRYLMTYAAFDTITFNKESCPVTVPIDDSGNIVDFLDRVDIYDPDLDDYVASVVLATRENFSGESITFNFDFGVLIE